MANERFHCKNLKQTISKDICIMRQHNGDIACENCNQEERAFTRGMYAKDGKLDEVRGKLDEGRKHLNFTDNEKRAIVTENFKNGMPIEGVKERCKKHNISAATFYNWKRKIDAKSVVKKQKKYSEIIPKNIPKKDNSASDKEKKLIEIILSDTGKMIKEAIQKEIELLKISIHDIELDLARIKTPDSERAFTEKNRTPLTPDELMLSKFPAFDNAWDNDIKLKWLSNFITFIEIFKGARITPESRGSYSVELLDENGYCGVITLVDKTQIYPPWVPSEPLAVIEVAKAARRFNLDLRKEGIDGGQ